MLLTTKRTSEITITTLETESILSATLRLLTKEYIILFLKVIVNKKK